MTKVRNSVRRRLRSSKHKLKNTQMRITATGTETYTNIMTEGKSVQHGDRTQEVKNRLRKRGDSGGGRREPGKMTMGATQKLCPGPAHAGWKLNYAFSSAHSTLRC